MSRESFGPRLRRSRLAAGISLEQISTDFKIPIELLSGLEQNDLSRWPAGIFSRAYIRQYACAVGLDPEETVDDFCRWFAQGDRRLWRTVFEHSSIIGHETSWTDELPGEAGVDRRGAVAATTVDAPARHTPSPLQVMIARLRRTFGRA